MPIEKGVVYDEDSEIATYTLVVNEKQIRLNDGKPYKLEDKYEGLDIDFQSIVIEPKDVKVEYSFHNNVGTFTIPDETTVTITYKGWPVGRANDTVTLKNEARMVGYVSETSESVVLGDHEGSAASYGVRILKYADDNMEIPLGGAVFQLYEESADGHKVAVTYQEPASGEEDEAWAKYQAEKPEVYGRLPTQENHIDGDFVYFITGEDGIANVMLSKKRDGVALNMGPRYYLREVVVPDGHEKENIDWQFIIGEVDDFSHYVYSNDSVLQVANPSTGDNIGLVVRKDFVDNTHTLVYDDKDDTNDEDAANTGKEEKNVQFLIEGVDASGAVVYSKTVTYGDFKPVDHEEQVLDENGDPVLDGDNNPVTKFTREYVLIIPEANLPAGSYTVTELKADMEGTERTTEVALAYNVTDAPGESATTKNFGKDTGVPVAAFELNKDDKKQASVKFTNTYNEQLLEERGKLTVEKKVEGLDETSDKAFKFTIQTSGKYLIESGELQNEEVEFALKANETKTFDGIKQGNYILTEVLKDAEVSGKQLTVSIQVDGSDATESNETRVAVGEDTVVTITNTYTEPTTDFTFGKLWVGPDKAKDDTTLPWPDGKTITVDIHRRQKGNRNDNTTVDANFQLTYTIKKGSDGKLTATQTGETGGEYELEILDGGTYSHYEFKLSDLPKLGADGKEWEYYAVETGNATGGFADLTFGDAEYGRVSGILNVVVENWKDAAANEGPTEENPDKLSFNESIINRGIVDKTFEIPVEKLLTGDDRAVIDGEFTFKIEPSSDGCEDTIHLGAGQTESFTVKPDMSHSLTYHARKYNEETKKYENHPYFTGSYTYTISEVIPEDGDKAEGVTYTGVTAKVTLNVELDWETGVVTATKTIAYSDGKKASDTEETQATVEFTNEYDEGKRPLKLTKLWDDDGNRDGKRGTVKFQVTGTATWEVRNVAEGRGRQRTVL